MVSRSTERQTAYMIKKAFGEQVRKIRQEKQITQEELSQKTGLANRFLQDIESGNKQASITTVFRLADGLGVSPNDLLEKPYGAWKKAGKPV